MAGEVTNSNDFLGKAVRVVMDRPLGSRHPRHGFLYSLNYGFAPDTLAPDGEALDAYVLGVFDPVAEYEGVCIAVIHRTNDDDDKLIVAPAGVNYSDEQIQRLQSFRSGISPRILFGKILRSASRGEEDFPLKRGLQR